MTHQAIEQWLFDKAGQRYRLEFLEEGSLWVFKVFDGPLLAATSHCLIWPQDLLLQDLLVLDDKPFLPLQPTGLTRVFTRWRKKRPSYRRRGLGSALLKHIIQRATEKGIQRITGHLLPHDLLSNPTIGKWFQRFGFVVHMTSPESGAIRLALPSSTSPGSSQRQ